MNIQSLCSTIRNAGLTRAIITVDTNGDDVVVIVNIPSASTDSSGVQCNTKPMELRKALSVPMRIMGKIAEVDDEINQHFTKYAEGFVPAAQALPVALKTNAPAAATKSKDAAEKVTAGVTSKVKKDAIKVVEAPKPSPVEAALPNVEMNDNYDFFSDSGAL
ncbi:hypothetical protein [Pseudoalteromonas sp. SR45-4]|uniref:hypothetical protein n=1 Tax=Pseudoalteromonas sp. SR45-4 TaxID=2760929 RepID=UPI0015FAB549|nr:hypothetical protein [Pseudoalteromonas sp. SR45-4]MBB1371254.1 hypothetical protein [Pseudoalteromonas sp. SR45-4]